MAVSITMKELLEAGVHFGHQTKRWNPKMKKYIFGKRNGIYIIDLQKTLKLFKEASAFISDLSSGGKRILFVGTKRQAQDAILEEANRCGMFYVNNRWLGGTLTNFTTVRTAPRLRHACLSRLGESDAPGLRFCLTARLNQIRASSPAHPAVIHPVRGKPAAAGHQDIGICFQRLARDP